MTVAFITYGVSPGTSSTTCVITKPSKRMDVMVKRSAKYGEFAGTSGQVLEYLKSKV